MTKKEIGMVKLMKYVEEMQKEGINICRPSFQEYYLLEMMLVSKYYGLIKWLVENDKIETNNLNLKVFKSMFSNDGTVEISYEELILMLLAISDEPIEFLCEILK